MAHVQNAAAEPAAQVTSPTGPPAPERLPGLVRAQIEAKLAWILALSQQLEAELEWARARRAKAQVQYLRGELAMRTKQAGRLRLRLEQPFTRHVAPHVPPPEGER